MIKLPDEQSAHQLPKLPDPVTAQDMKESLNIPMFQEEAECAASAFNQCLLECQPVYDAAKRIKGALDECLKEMDAMQENINYKYKTLIKWRKRAIELEAEVQRLNATAQHDDSNDGYVKAFYEITSILGIPAQPNSPKHVFEMVMKPKLHALVDSGQPKCQKCGDTGMADSGGTQPWGEQILIECDCATAQPVSDGKSSLLTYLNECSEQVSRWPEWKKKGSEVTALIKEMDDFELGFVNGWTERHKQPVSDGLYQIANHIAGAKNSLPQEWQDWAEEIESDLRKLAAAPGGQDDET